MTVTVTDVATHARALASWLQEHAEEVEPYRDRAPGGIDAAVEHDRGLLALLHEAGWSRWGWPEEVGGLGGPVALRAALYDELAAADVEVPEAYVILETLGPLLAAFAPPIAREHLPLFLAGEQVWGQGFSEPDAGSDLAGLRTRAEVVGDGSFRLSGQKIWTTLGQFASHAAVLARTGAPDSAHRGLTMLWVDLSAPGVTVRAITASNGRDEFAEMFFDDVTVPASGLIGDVGGGWAAAMYLLQYERGMYAWLRQAVLHRRLRQAAASAPAHASASAVAALGRAQRLCAGLRARSRTTVLRLSAGENPGPEISVDKVLLGECEQAVFDACRRLGWTGMALGGETTEATLREEWFYSRASTIFGGAADIQRDILADRVLGLPRSAR
ncbi:acyl-CoA dehydrogenase family protein [Intrasporangium mesophilum]